MDENPYRAPAEKGTKLSDLGRFVKGVWFAAALLLANLAICVFWIAVRALHGLAWWDIPALVATMATVSFGLSVIMRRVN